MKSYWNGHNMKSVKHMTLDQIKRIKLNNYCGEHDRNGKQFDYEAMGYRDEIDKRYWDLVQRDYLNQLKNINKMPENPAVTSVKVISRGMDQERLESAKNTLKNEIEAMDIQLSVLKAFNKWRFISNSIEYYM